MPKVTIRPSQLQNGDLSYVYAIPANANAARLFVHLDISAADLVDETKSVGIAIQIQDGAEWRDFLGLYWRGVAGVRPAGKGDGNPGFAVNRQELAGKTIRFLLSVPVPMTFGIVGEV